MQFTLPYQDFLIIPSGAGPGDPAVSLIIISGLPVVALYTGDPAELEPGLLFAQSLGVATRGLASALRSPSLVGNIGDVTTISQINLESQSIDGSEVANIETMIKGNIISLGRGVLDQLRLTGNSIGYSADADTDMALINAVTLFEGRFYGIHLHSQYSLNAAGTWRLECELDGVGIGHFGWASSTAAIQDDIDGWVFFTALITETTNDILVHVNEITGASTLTFEAAATMPRTLEIFDFGKL